MAPRIVLSMAAIDDLRNIEDYIVEQSGQMRAGMVMGRIEETMRLLAFMPGIGRVKRGLPDGSHVFSTSPWLIVYRVLADRDGIFVRRVIDGRRDLKPLLDIP